MKSINLHQKSKKLQILMEKGWNISFWVKNMEGQVFAKIFQYSKLPRNAQKCCSKVSKISHFFINIFKNEAFWGTVAFVRIEVGAFISQAAAEAC